MAEHQCHVNVGAMLFYSTSVTNWLFFIERVLRGVKKVNAMAIPTIKHYCS